MSLIKARIHIQVERRLAWTYIVAFLICFQTYTISVLEGKDFAMFHTSSLTEHSNTVAPGICTTWGNIHFRSFDGAYFHFPGLCNYIFSSHCKSSYEDFNIQIKREFTSSHRHVPFITRIFMVVDGVAIKMTNKNITFNDNIIKLPYSSMGIMIEKLGDYFKVIAKAGLTLMWNGEDALMMELDPKYMNTTCGLCGDFSSNKSYKEFMLHGMLLTPIEFGNMQRENHLAESCEDVPSSEEEANDLIDSRCKRILSGPNFATCHRLVLIEDYVKACSKDANNIDDTNSTGMCRTISAYSQHCTFIGGQPYNWRTEKFCHQKCPFPGMKYKECGSVCMGMCSNPNSEELCEGNCIAGCFCPPEMVLDDYFNSGCIRKEKCACLHFGKIYEPGNSFTTDCQKCTCTKGAWKCKDLPCPKTCSIEGNSHFTTFDGKRFTFHGNCHYILVKLQAKDSFVILGEIRQCGLLDAQTCMKSITLSTERGEMMLEIHTSGAVLIDKVVIQLPFSSANLTVFKPSTFYITLQTVFGLTLQVQLVPIMQVFMTLSVAYKAETLGLCGNYNDIPSDDFMTINELVEETASSFGNAWKSHSLCPNVKDLNENPCATSVIKERYAQPWCSILLDVKGPFAHCRMFVNPAPYFKNCLYDTCVCEQSEDCMCAALSSYVRACTTKGVSLTGWRSNFCQKYMHCPETMTYMYHGMTGCNKTCWSLTNFDIACIIHYIPVDGCGCTKGTFLDDNNQCVNPIKCPCYYKGLQILSGEAMYENDVICKCNKGILHCIGKNIQETACPEPMIYIDCSEVPMGTTGAECQKTCESSSLDCYSSECISGCVCPKGLVADGNHDCIPVEECPCLHNQVYYKSGSKIKVGCNTCVCGNRKWECSDFLCHGTCSVYGDGHYKTFDKKHFDFKGACSYVLVQDLCDRHRNHSTFSIVTENIICGIAPRTCSKMIRIFLGDVEIKLYNGKYEMQKRHYGITIPYRIYSWGLYIIIETSNGLMLIWDKKTTVYIKLDSYFRGKVCGLCGNFDDNQNNDFMSREKSIEQSVEEFGNSWKVTPSCPNAKAVTNPCFTNPHRRSRAERQCSIINSASFKRCHAQVNPVSFYHTCLWDTCTCETTNDFECLCTAIAAYAAACNEVHMCIHWRVHDFCSINCEFSNLTENEYSWHYKACGVPCLKTCRNPTSKCSEWLPRLEGCYPLCPPEMPYFDEIALKCVSRQDCTPCSMSDPGCLADFKAPGIPHFEVPALEAESLGRPVTEK
ncbi:mucin-5AC-like isoform X2 [Rhinatrema bivittatum]|uniref:mucin-5AC-like isoform X2 n=1 Tax=Rhinatrema bivittatum TaxID=194408 RepID=UPI001129E405|nr:mucin-5AC-like isoform X2 [Rhinatrema bivittatum]